MPRPRRQASLNAKQKIRDHLREDGLPNYLDSKKLICCLKKEEKEEKDAERKKVRRIDDEEVGSPHHGVSHSFDKNVIFSTMGSDAATMNGFELDNERMDLLLGDYC